MAGSDHIQVPIEALQRIDRTLSSMKSELDGLVGHANQLIGADDIHGSKITAALNSYYGEWEDPRRKLLDNVGKLGEVSGKIAEATAKYDDDMAKNFDQFAAKLKGKE